MLLGEVYAIACAFLPGEMDNLVFKIWNGGLNFLLFHPAVVILSGIVRGSLNIRKEIHGWNGHNFY